MTDNNQPTEKKKYKYPQPSKAIKSPELKEHLQNMIAVRFLLEVHELERSGRVESRSQLERDLMVPLAAISVIRAGRRKLDVVELARFKELYNADVFYILTGFRKPEISGPLKGGVRLDKFEGFEFEYRTAPSEVLAGIAEKIDKDRGVAGLGLKAHQPTPEQE
ncbi:hypothetical protein [Hymenobacter metallicola]|uniref:Uncharacterized protein n=1 Tax=Hymenobacter metallicola TaxID=2563114 RepID=A0A4Z0QKR4_9BACT|nr:hypothetical protein [Hymenobacter metallicola]TGE29849.1 hypothetical protein E5K02_10420 [Hymenobacter metallicola]